MKLTVVGSSPAWPNPGRAHSGYLLEHDGRRLLVDCGPGVLSRLREAEGWPVVDAIAITHTHLDHCGDLVAWLWGQLHVPAAKEAVAPLLWLPPGGHDDLRAMASRFDEVFSVDEYADRTPFTAAGFSITPHAVAHYDQPDVRASGSRRTGASSRSRRTPGRPGAGRTRGRCRPLPLRGDARRRRGRGYARAPDRGRSSGCSPRGERAPAVARPPAGGAHAAGRLRARVRRARADALEDRRLPPGPPDLAERVAHLAHRHVRAGRFDDRVHQVPVGRAPHPPSAARAPPRRRPSRAALAAPRTRSICSVSSAGSIFRISSGCLRRRARSG